MAAQAILDALDESDHESMMDMLESSTDSSETSDSDEFDVAHPETHAKVMTFLETIEEYSDSDFQTHFRMERTTVQFIIGKFKK